MVGSSQILPDVHQGGNLFDSWFFQDSPQKKRSENDTAECEVNVAKATITGRKFVVGWWWKIDGLPSTFQAIDASMHHRSCLTFSFVRLTLFTILRPCSPKIVSWTLSSARIYLNDCSCCVSMAPPCRSNSSLKLLLPRLPPCNVPNTHHKLSMSNVVPQNNRKS